MSSKHQTNQLNIKCLCIPRVLSTITENHIRKIFTELDIGIVGRIDIVNKTTNGEKTNCVYVHLKHWHNNSNAKLAYDRLIEGKEIKILYDEPWFWKVSAYKLNESKLNEIKSNESKSNESKSNV